ncbi:MAG: nucleotide exchange factor GrpE [Kiloniellaceae bacterium]
MAQDKKQNQETAAGETAIPETEPGTIAESSPVDTGDEPLVDLSNIAHATELSPDEDPVQLLEREVASLKDQLLRAMAETENVRRRAQREREDGAKYAAAPVVRDLLGVADNLQRALESVPEELAAENEQVKNLRLGVEMTQKELQAVFERHNIRTIEPLGDKLDPHLHEAMFEIEDLEKPAGTVVQVIQSGYRLHDRLLRPARVGISKGGAKAASGETENGAARPGDTIDTSA